MTTRTALAMVLAGLGALVACEATPADTNDTDCSDGYTCTAALTVTFEDGRSEFEVVMYGEGFNTLSVFCPDGVSAGGSGQDLAVTCEEGGFSLTASEYAFPGTFFVSVDEGLEREVQATFSAESEECGIACNTGSLAL